MRKLLLKFLVINLCLLGVRDLAAIPGEPALTRFVPQALKGIKQALNIPLVRAGFVGLTPYGFCSLTEHVKNREYKVMDMAYKESIAPMTQICGIASGGLFWAGDASGRHLTKQAAKNLVPFFRGLSLVTSAPAVLLSVANVYFLVTEDRDKQRIKVTEVDIDDDEIDEPLKLKIKRRE